MAHEDALTGRLAYVVTPVLPPTYQRRVRGGIGSLVPSRGKCMRCSASDRSLVGLVKPPLRNKLLPRNGMCGEDISPNRHFTVAGGSLRAVVSCGWQNNTPVVFTAFFQAPVDSITIDLMLQHLITANAAQEDKPTLDKMLSLVPKEQWEDPPEDSYLYMMKLYAETYGEGKATRMGW